MVVKKFKEKLDCIIITVPHKQFLKLKQNFFKSFKK